MKAPQKPIVAFFGPHSQTEVFSQPTEGDELGNLAASCLDLIRPSLAMSDGQKARAIVIVQHRLAEGKVRQVVGCTDRDPSKMVSMLGEALRSALGPDAFQALMRAFIENDD